MTKITTDNLESVVTTVGTPGNDTNIPTEKAVRDAIGAGGGGGGGGVDLSYDLQTTIVGDWNAGILFPDAGFLYCSASQSYSNSYLGLGISDDGITYTTIAQFTTAENDSNLTYKPLSLYVSKNSYIKITGNTNSGFNVYGFMPIES